MCIFYEEDKESGLVIYSLLKELWTRKIKPNLPFSLKLFPTFMWTKSTITKCREAGNFPKVMLF